jgi:hypothetical protein
VRSAPANIIAAATLLACAAGCATAPRQRPVAVVWDVLPFPKDSDWPGPKGAAASLEKSDLVLQGRPVRTVKTYSVPLTVECEVFLEVHSATDGGLHVRFVPPGEPADANLLNSVDVLTGYRNHDATRQALSIQRLDSSIRGKILWGEQPFTIDPGKPYHLKVQLLPDRIRISVDGTTYEAKGVAVPYETFHIQLMSWQPTNRIHVRNFALR